MADFHSKMSVCRHELGGGFNPQPPTIPTLSYSLLPAYSVEAQAQGFHGYATILLVTVVEAK